MSKVSAAQAAKDREYSRRYRLRNREKELARFKRYRGEHPERTKIYAVRRDPVKVKSRQTLRNAVQEGKVIKPSACQKCGGTDKILHGHHDDYNKPFEVHWLCSQCHGLEHRKVE